MEKILSIIIPAYNVEKYLKRCLFSIATVNPFLLEKTEILIIDDGSTDTTPDIALKYCQKYPGIFFLYSKENGGHGSAVNTGIYYASGKYFKVLDGDDWFATKELQKLIELLETLNVDAIASDYLCIKDGTGQVLSKKSCTYDNSQYEKTCYMSKGEIKKVIKMHSLAIKTEYLKNMPYRLDEHCFYVDAEYITYPALNIESVYYTRICPYMYRLGRNGQSMDIKNMQKNRAQHMRVYRSLVKFYKTACNEETPLYTKNYIEKCIAQIVENQFQIYISLGLQNGIKEELENWDNKMEKDYPGIYNSVGKKSIMILRKSKYRLLKAAAVLYNITR